MATHSRILAWEFPWAEEPGGLQSMGIAKSQTQLKRYCMNAYLCRKNRHKGRLLHLLTHLMHFSYHVFIL